MKKYYRRNPIAIIRLHILDFFSSFFFHPNSLPDSPSRILLCHSGHLGDVIISTSLLRYLRCHQGIRHIGFLCGDWNFPVLNNHPGIDSLHKLNHWRSNRSSNNFFSRYFLYLFQIRKVIKSISAKNYDIAIILNSFEPSYIPVLARIKSLPLSGFSSAGYSSLLAKVIDPFSFPGLHEIEYQAKLLDGIIKVPQSSIFFKPWLIQSAKSNVANYFSLSSKKYIVLHPGSGSPIKEWSMDKWVSLANLIHNAGFSIFVTGMGKRDKAVADAINLSVPIQNFVDRLDFGELVSCISNSLGMVCLDSSVAHVASAFDIPTIVISGGFGEVGRWNPLSSNSKVISMKLPCSPCFNRPCKERLCINALLPLKIFSEFSLIISAL